MNISELVDKYISVRDKRAEIEAEAKAKKAKCDEALDLIEARLLKLMEETGVDSFKTEAGTAYKSHKNSATCADWDAVWEFVQQDAAHQSILEHRVNKTFVQAYKEEHGELPPGVNWRSVVSVNFRRS